MSYLTYPQTYKTDLMVGDKKVTVEVGKFSEQASAAVLVTCGETVVSSTITLGRKVELGYFPLSVEFVEKLYSAGIIKGSQWVKRDGRPGDDVILKARVIDRTLRPLFPKGIKHEVQIINTVFSYDGENDPDMLGLLGSALGLAVSDIPFEGPVAGLRMGYRKETGEFTVNPTNSERATGDLDLIVSGSGSTIAMVEAGANEISEAIMVEALVKAQEQLGQICEQIDAIAAEIGKPKLELVTEEEKAAMDAVDQLAALLMKKFAAEIRTVVEREGRLEKVDTAELIETMLAAANEGRDETELLTDKDIKTALGVCLKKDARAMILNEQMRPDGRKTDEIRPIWCEVDVFPRTHGSAMFKRGATQVASVTTLGNPTLGQSIESIDGTEVRHYMHHYNMPPYASGETGRFGFPSRREVGHGALAERALRPMVPSQAEFPYTILVVSEVVSSNGSTSQASICGSTMSLMSAGVPIKRPVSGIAMGLISDGAKYQILSDIQGLEDHVGDMDFKVAGTTEGITAIQMDIKLTGLNRQILEEALEQARVGRAHILGKMLEVIGQPRTELSQYAPKVRQLRIPADRIGELIGPGGKMIKSLIEQTGADINVDEDKETEEGVVNISSSDQAKIDHAYEMISGMMRVINIGEEFDGPVTRVESYGAFVEYLPGREGLVHVSQMDTEFVPDANAKVKFGDVVHVRVSGMKDDGKIELSMLTPEQEEEVKAKRSERGGDRGGDRGFGGGSRGGFGGGRGDRRGGFRGGDRGGDRGGRGNFRGDRGGRH